jgi:hypothetical protein
MDSLFPVGLVVAVEASCMADIAELLFYRRLLIGKRDIDLLQNGGSIFEIEPRIL